MNASGSMVKRLGYTPYGSDWYEENTTGNYKVKYRFTGKEKDATRLYYFGARYYDPDLRRFGSMLPFPMMIMRYLPGLSMALPEEMQGLIRNLTAWT